MNNSLLLLIVFAAGSLRFGLGGALVVMGVVWVAIKWNDASRRQALRHARDSKVIDAEFKDVTPRDQADGQ